VLDRLGKLDAGDADFENLLSEFITAALEHISYEEQEVWPRPPDPPGRSRLSGLKPGRARVHGR